jgi:hypothetical protein
MEKIQAFKTSDGQIFETKEQANTHQKEIQLKLNVEHFVEKKCYSGMEKEHIVDMILDNRLKLLSILNHFETIIKP